MPRDRDDDAAYLWDMLDAARIKQDRIWRVVTHHVPDLIAKLRPLIPELPKA